MITNAVANHERHSVMRGRAAQLGVSGFLCLLAGCSGPVVDDGTGGGTSSGGTSSGGASSGGASSGGAPAAGGQAAAGAGTGGSSKCGGLLGLTCAKGQYCDFPASTACGSGDQQGTCKVRPEVCPEIFIPVCGCDGKTYPNACFAALAGTAVLTEAACAPQTGVTTGQ